MALSLNTSHPLYSSLVALFCVDSDNVIKDLKGTRACTPDAAVTVGTGAFGKHFTTTAVGLNAKGVAFNPGFPTFPSTSPRTASTFIVINSGSAIVNKGQVFNGAPNNCVTPSVSSSGFPGVSAATATPYLVGTTNIVGTGAHSFGVTQNATDSTVFCDGVIQATGAKQSYASDGSLASYIGGAPSGNWGGFPASYVWVAQFSKELNATEIADLHASLGVDNAFGLVSAAANTSPTFSGPNIGAQFGTVGVALTSNDIASKFSDTDALTFTKGGTWPAGVNLSSVGLISGTPTTAGTYAGLSVIATDTGALSVSSDTFAFTISATADTTVPTQTGAIVISDKTTTSYTATWPAGADNVGVTGYQYRINAGVWQTLGNVLSVDITGRTPGATDTFEVRAFDGATNYSTPALSVSVTLNTASGSFVSDAMENNTGAGLLVSTPVSWTWYKGAIGASPTDMIHGTGTTSALGVLTATGLPVGAGFLLARTTDSTGVYYQPGTVV